MNIVNCVNFCMTEFLGLVLEKKKKKDSSGSFSSQASVMCSGRNLEPEAMLE